MARQTRVELIDDLDGGEADNTITFGLDGATYEIDLSEDNAKSLREALAPYVDAARRTNAPTRRRSPDNSDKGYGTYNPREVRAWARQNGLEPGDRGRIPAAVVEAWRSRT